MAERVYRHRLNCLKVIYSKTDNKTVIAELSLENVFLNKF